MVIHLDLPGTFSERLVELKNILGGLDIFSSLFLGIVLFVLYLPGKNQITVAVIYIHSFRCELLLKSRGRSADILTLPLLTITLRSLLGTLSKFQERNSL